jgi:hypothetical protein
MKRLLLPFTFLICFVSGCQQDEPVPEQQDIEFTLDASQSQDLPDEIVADVTIESAGNGLIEKSITFHKVADRYVSAAFSINPGRYRIKAFRILATSEANVASLIREFSTTLNGQKQIALGRAVKSHGTKPMMLTVYIEHEGKKLTTDAKAMITNDDGEYYEYYLSPKQNNIKFQGNPQTSYTITIEKEGYGSYTNTFVYNQLDKKHLEVTLQLTVVQPGLAVTFQPSATVFTLWIGFIDKGTIVLDWGKGEIETINFDVDPENETSTGFVYREQAYVTSIPQARITGDVHLIKSIYFEEAVDGLDPEYASGS